MKKSNLLALIAVSIFAITFTNGNAQACEKGKKADHFKKLDTDKNGSLSKSEWETKFMSIDTDKNGSLSNDEMKAHHKAEKKSCKNKKS